MLLKEERQCLNRMKTTRKVVTGMRMNIHMSMDMNTNMNMDMGMGMNIATQKTAATRGLMTRRSFDSM